MLILVFRFTAGMVKLSNLKIRGVANRNRLQILNGLTIPTHSSQALCVNRRQIANAYLVKAQPKMLNNSARKKKSWHQKIMVSMQYQLKT